MEMSQSNQAIDPKELLFAFQQGAIQLINQKQVLNQINVFPVSDGDTGSNLASLMQTILEETKEESSSVVEVFEKVAEASLVGARGNSGIIFAQYFNGIYNHLLKLEEKSSVQSFVESVKSAIGEAYQAIEQPVEGTIITVIRSWAEALDDSEQVFSLESLLPNALHKAKQSLENTTNQLKILKKNQVVDAGAKGFYLFIEGFTEAFLTKQAALHLVNEPADGIKIEQSPQEHSHTSEPRYRYCTEVFLDQVALSKSELQQKLNAYGDSLIVAVNRGKARIHIHTNQPAEVLDYLSSVGNPIQQKVDDMLLQYHVNQQRKAPIALVTDSIADLPAEYLLENQIHVLPMNILLGTTSYLDKLTLQTKQLFDLAKETEGRATSSQPTLKTVENLFSFLETRYEAILVITVAGKLSGTYYTVKEAAKRSHAIPIEVIDSRQNSAAQGLLVMNATEWIQAGIPFAEVVSRAAEKREQLKILVSVDELDPMIDSGRIPQAVGKLAKQVNLKPIVSLDEYGEGKLSNFAFSRKGNEKKILREMKKVNQKHKIKRYAIIHVNNEAKAKLWGKKLRELLAFPPSYITDSSTVIAMSAGEGSVAVAYELGGDEK
ncbi:DegV family EDD domain-containing protein [Candidatus Enterococcus murrayae]|uniref:DegV family EDD domain-containing protein n=1 Tax=Candidatus Enterococcus murrayae TaxID=2815321 RepID=A0ABS3HGY2_9ENTE|nr:DegV family protein [Enterococcus sp. MJM16]MBO0452709.1 DegV family EDD domain-containing protein [Enterococcus sp. MJM16]